MYCTAAALSAMVLMLLPTAVLHRETPAVQKLSILMRISQDPILVPLPKLLVCMIPQVSCTGDTSQNIIPYHIISILYLRVLDICVPWIGEGFLARLRLGFGKCVFILLSSFGCLRVQMKSWTIQNQS